MLCTKNKKIISQNSNLFSSTWSSCVHINQWPHGFSVFPYQQSDVTHCFTLFFPPCYCLRSIWDARCTDVHAACKIKRCILILPTAFLQAIIRFPIKLQKYSKPCQTLIILYTNRACTEKHFLPSISFSPCNFMIFSGKIAKYCSRGWTFKYILSLKNECCVFLYFYYISKNITKHCPVSEFYFIFIQRCKILPSLSWVFLHSKHFRCNISNMHQKQYESITSAYTFLLYNYNIFCS